MSFGGFLKRVSSVQSDGEKNNTPRGTGFLSGTTKLLDSVNAKRTGFVSDMSTKFDQIKRRASQEALAMTDKEAENETPLSEGGPPLNTASTVSSSQDCVPQAPNHPQQVNRESFNEHGKQPENVGFQSPPVEQLSHAEGNTSCTPGEQWNQTRQQSADKAAPPKRPPPALPPNHTRNTNPFLKESEQQQQPVTTSTKPKPPKPPPPRQNTNPFLNLENKTPSISKDPPFLDRRNSLVDDEDIPDHNRKSSIHDDFGFTSENNHSFQGPTNPGATVATNVECQKIVTAMDDLMKFDEGDDDSSASEYGDEGDKPIYADEAAMQRRGSTGSNDSLKEEAAAKYGDFMHSIVYKIFSQHEEITQSEKEQFGVYCQNHFGRGWFARRMERQSVNEEMISDDILFNMVQFFAVALTECDKAEDYYPATSLMKLAASFYTQGKHHMHAQRKLYLRDFLRDQTIWQSIRFWNAAFFKSVHEARSMKSPIGAKTRQTTTKTPNEEENLVCKQLSVYLRYMRSYGLSTENCYKFLQKQAEVLCLSKAETKLLAETIDLWSE